MLIDKLLELAKKDISLYIKRYKIADNIDMLNKYPNEKWIQITFLLIKLSNRF